jgi:type I site-specific restriction endonuclease
MTRYIDDTTSLDYAERQDQEWLREEQAQWFEEFRTEAELCCYFPAAESYLRALHMGDIPF